jgi:signal transduction histidine kinase
VNAQPVDVAGELAALRAMFRAFVRSSAVTLSIDPPAEAIQLRTDPVLLGHILRNLLSNALKFTDAGEVRVSAGSLPDGEVAFAVADTGVGIASEDVARIFEPWGQVDDGDCRPAGSGLGLPLVRRLVDALGGRLELETALGRGSTFTVVLPSGAPSLA